MYKKIELKITIIFSNFSAIFFFLIFRDCLLGDPVGQRVGAGAAGVRGDRHFVHHVRAAGVHPVQQDADHHGVGPRVVLRAADRHPRVLPDDLRHPGKTHAGHVHHFARRPRRMPHHLLQRHHHQDQPHLAHLQPRHQEHPATLLHLAQLTGLHLPRSVCHQNIQNFCFFIVFYAFFPTKLMIRAVDFSLFFG
jgi:hypothetical protein